MGYNLLKKGGYWGYNLLTNLLLTSWDIQVYPIQGGPRADRYKWSDFTRVSGRK